MFTYTYTHTHTHTASGVKSVQLFFIINQPDALISQNVYFGRKIYMF